MTGRGDPGGTAGVMERDAMDGDRGAATGATIDVDIGGTFTDCFVRLGDGRSAAVKAPTTGHRLSLGFLRGLESAAAQLGMDTAALIAATGSIRYSTTVAMNTLIQRSGPRLGLIVTEGFEDVLRIGKGASWMDALVLREIEGLSYREIAIALGCREGTVKSRINRARERLKTLLQPYWQG